MESLSPVDDEEGRFAALQRHARSRGIALHLGRQALQTAGQYLRGWLPAGPWRVVCDATTWQIAGQTIAAQLPSDAERHRLTPRPDSSHVTAGDTEEASLMAALQAQGATAAVAIGSGSINDITRAACDRLGLPYAVVATAPSMNGYLSAGVALLVDGLKTTRPCSPPVGCIADAGLLAAAPAAMRGAGYGDLRSRVTSCADWALSHVLTGSDYVPAALGLVDEADRMIDGIEARLSQGDEAATMGLIGGLLLSGLAMDMAGSSAPPSGAEHLVSHLLDMEHYALGLPHDLHGRQVGVATIAIAVLYEQLLELITRGSIDLRQLAQTRPWHTTDQQLQQIFGPLWPATRGTARTASRIADSDVLARLDRFACADELAPLLRSSLSPARQLQQELAAAGAPVSFAALGVDLPRARRVLLNARHIRSRYTILDLAAELGCLDAWVEEALMRVGD